MLQLTRLSTFRLRKRLAESFDIEVLEEDLDAFIEEEMKKEEKAKALSEIDEKLLKRRSTCRKYHGAR